jgi:hypothetical protein
MAMPSVLAQIRSKEVQMIFIRDFDGDVIARSKNLRGINDRCRKVPGAKPWVYFKDDATVVDVTWPDGSFAVVPFASGILAYKYAATKRFQRAPL